MPTVPTIWIVDDDASFRRGMQRLVSSLACAVEVCGSGDELLARLAGAQPTCVLLDIHMPDKSGIETLQQIVAQGIQVPTVMMTGVERQGMRETCLAAGAYDVVAKPLPAATITALLHRIQSGHGT